MTHFLDLQVSSRNINLLISDLIDLLSVFYIIYNDRPYKLDLHLVFLLPSRIFLQDNKALKDMCKRNIFLCS